MKKLVLAGIISAAFASPCASAFYITPSFQHSTSSSINGSNDDVTTSTYGIEAGTEDFFVGYTYKNYDFDHASDLDSLKRIYGGYRYFGELTGNVDFSLGIRGSLGWRDDFDITESYTVVPFGAFIFPLQNELSLIAGGGVYFSVPKDYLFPILMLKYGSPRSLGFSGAVGFPDNFVTYRFSQALALQGQLKINAGNSYYLGDEHYFGRNQKTYLVENSAELSAHVIFNPSENIEIKGGVAYTFERDLNFYNSHGDKIAKYDIDNDLAFKVGCTFNF
ncbi:MAG: hypothetical protein ACI4M9_01640 [Succinivibrio sp.]